MFFGIVGSGMSAIAVLSQEQVLLEQAGFSAANAATLLGITAAGAFIGSLSIGWLLDRFNTMVSCIAVAGAIATGIVAFASLFHSPILLIAAIGAFTSGYGAGSGEVLWINLTKRQFGERAFPVTYGGWYFALQAGYAAGGSLAGWSFSELGTVGFLAFVGLVYLPPAICSVAIRAGRMPAQRRSQIQE